MYRYAEARSRRAGTTIYYAVDDQHVAALLPEAEYHADGVRQGLPDHRSYPPAAPRGRRGVSR